MSTALARTGILDEPAGLAHARELADTLSRSELLVPAHLRGKPSDILLALSMAQLLGQPALVVLQSIYVLGGKPGWSAAFIIGLANNSGVFKGPIDWREKGEGDGLEVTAYAVLQDGREVAFTVSMKMAHAEGWTRNSKYKTLGPLMLRYRSATLLVRLYAPGVLMGLHTVEELRDVAAAAGAEEYVVEPQQEQRPRPVAQLEQRTEAVTVGSPEPPLPRELREPPKREEPKKEPEPTAAHSSWPDDEVEFKRSITELGMDPGQVESMLRVKGGKAPQLMDRAGRSKLVQRLETFEGRAAYDEHVGVDFGEPQFIEAADHADALGGPTSETVLKLAQASGLPVDRQQGPVTDGAPIPALRRFLWALRLETRKVQA